MYRVRRQGHGHQRGSCRAVIPVAGLLQREVLVEDVASAVLTPARQADRALQEEPAVLASP